MSELNLFDYSARQYDPIIGRFTTMDPLCEKYYSISPYAYCLTNPLKFVDPTGKSPWDPPMMPGAAYTKQKSAEIISRAESGEAPSEAISNAYAFEKEALTYTDLNDLTVLVTGFVAVFTGDSPMNIDGSKATWTDFDNVKSAILVPVVSGSAISKTGKAIDNFIDGAKKTIGPIGDPGGKVMKQLPESMQNNARTSNNKNGTFFKDPENPKGNHVRVQNADNSSPYPSQQTPYVKETRNGASIDKSGNSTNPKASEAHIPRNEYKYKNK